MEKIKAGRPKGSLGKNNRRKNTITLHNEDWSKLSEIGPSQSKAVEFLLRRYENDKLYD